MQKNRPGESGPQSIWFNRENEKISVEASEDKYRVVVKGKSVPTEQAFWVQIMSQSRRIDRLQTQVRVIAVIVLCLIVFAAVLVAF